MIEEEREEESKVEVSDLVGQLYPVLFDKFGNMIDGYGRLKNDPNWKTETLPHIDTPEKFLVAQWNANVNRREVPVSEKRQLINALAEEYVKQGCKVLTTKNEVKKKIMGELNLTSPTVLKYLDAKYKPFTKEEVKPVPRKPASEVIANKMGEDYVERLKEELKPEIVKEIYPKIKRKVIMEELPSTIEHKKPKKQATKKDLLDAQEQLNSVLDFPPQYFEMDFSKFEEFVEPLEKIQQFCVEKLAEFNEEEKQEILKSIHEAEKKLRQIKETLETTSENRQ